MARAAALWMESVGQSNVAPVACWACDHIGSGTSLLFPLSSEGKWVAMQTVTSQLGLMHLHWLLFY